MIYRYTNQTRLKKMEYWFLYLDWSCTIFAVLIEFNVIYAFLVKIFTCLQSLSHGGRVDVLSLLHRYFHGKFSWKPLLSSEFYHDDMPSYLHGVESLSFPRIPNIRQKLHWAFSTKTCSFVAQISHTGASLNPTIITFSYQTSIFISPHNPLLPSNPL